jgi:AmiR/NasT family two-component response regulator
MTGNALIQNLRNTRVGVVHPQDGDGEDLVRHLQRIGLQTKTMWPPPTQLPAPLDAVFFLLDGDLKTSMPWRSAEPQPAMIAIVDYENPTVLKALIDSNANAVLVRPIRPAGILSSLVLALSQKSYESRLITKVAKLEETLKTRREVEKATRILMGLKNVSESEAYQLIRRQATAKRVSISVIASSIIRATEMLDGLKLDAD